MFRRLLSAGLVATFTLSALPAAARPDDEHRGRGREREERRDDRRDDRRADRRDDRREDGKYWKERDKAERKYWKERDKEARKYDRHRYYDDDRDHDRGRNRHYRAPAWMDGYWRPGDDRRYVALVPGDPSRMYVFLEGRWVLRQVRDPRARLDLEGAFQLPMAPPPVAPPHLGVNLHVVLFN
jgi:Ni/Co efflux regulator RcnB